MILYIDPGTGGLIISLILSYFITLIIFFKKIIIKVVSFFSFKTYKKNDFSGEIVLFSEGKNYWNVFSPIIEQLVIKKQSFVYLSCDKKDPGLSMGNSLISSHYIGKMQFCYLSLNNLRAKLFISSTPQLNIFEWKRSPFVEHYCYLSHAPMDVHANKKFSFDYYDSILCGNSFQIKNLRYLEKLRGSKKKILLKSGCSYYDLLKRRKSMGKSILVAPTWGERSFLKSSLEELLFNLIKNNQKIILRPHPQSWISDLKVLNKIIQKFKNYKNLKIDRNVDLIESILDSKIIITDISSGIIYDAFFIYNINVIAIDNQMIDYSYESSDLKNKSSVEYLIDDFGTKIEKNEIFNINKIINSISKNKLKLNSSSINDHLFNFQKASPIISDQIINLHKSLND